MHVEPRARHGRADGGGDPVPGALVGPQTDQVHRPGARAPAARVTGGESGGGAVREVEARAGGVDQCGDPVGRRGAAVRHDLDPRADRQPRTGVHRDLVRTGRRPARHPRVRQEPRRGPAVPRRPRVLRDRGDAGAGVDQCRGEADVADGRGDAGQGGQPVDEPGRDRGPFGQREGEVPARVELLVGGDHDVRAAEPPGRDLRTQPRLGEHAGGGDQGRAAEDRARHGEQGGDPVRGHPQGEVQHGYRSPTRRAAPPGAAPSAAPGPRPPGRRPSPARGGRGPRRPGRG